MENMAVTATVRLFDQDAYAKEFEGTVLSCKEVIREDRTLFAIILDKTLFFPEEGGQSPDKGQLNNINIVDVQIKDDVITHYAEASIAEGQTVKGQIDWTHRFSNMQQHSGEHIFSGIVHNRFGYENVGFHLSDQVVTMDFSGPLSQEQIAQVELAVNQAISENVSISASFPSREELSQMNYRSKIEIEGQVRIVCVEGYDLCACCAPHVRRTGEIGLLKVMSAINYKGGVRISILCGFRALNAFRDKIDVISGLTNFLTTSQDNLLDTVKKLKTANQSLSSQLAQVNQQLLEQKLTNLPSDQRNVILFEDNLDMKIARNVINGLVEKHQGLCGIFVGDDSTGYNYILASQTIDCKALSCLLRDKLNAKGGGSERMIQGSVSCKASELCSVLDNL